MNLGESVVGQGRGPQAVAYLVSSLALLSGGPWLARLTLGRAGREWQAEPSKALTPAHPVPSVEAP